MLRTMARARLAAIGPEQARQEALALALEQSELPEDPP
jgi:hypothetical protein